MGLDSIELVMEVEESFDIKIPDDEACAMRTVGDLYQYLLRALDVPADGQGACITAATFRLLRRTLYSQFQIGDSRLRPNDRLDEILPKAGRRVFWERLQHSLDLQLPSLELSGRVKWGLVLAVLATAACGAFASSSLGPGSMMLSAVASAVLAGYLYSMVFAPLAIRPGVAFATLGGLAQEVSGRNYSILTERFDARATQEEVWRRLREIIVNQLGVEPAQVVPEARFVNDLGMQ